MIVQKSASLVVQEAPVLLALEEFRCLGVQFISSQKNSDTSSPLGQALFTIVSAVAQLEPDLIRERVSAGIRKARAKGKQLGHPRMASDVKKIASLRTDGMSWREIAQQTGISSRTIRRLIAGWGNNVPDSGIASH